MNCGSRLVCPLFFGLLFGSGCATMNSSSSRNYDPFVAERESSKEISVRCWSGPAEITVTDDLGNSRDVGQAPTTFTASPDRTYTVTARHVGFVSAVCSYPTLSEQLEYINRVAHSSYVPPPHYWPNIEFDLARDFSSELAQVHFEPDYMKRVLEVVGLCDKALRSPRMLIGSVYADAQSAFDKMNLDYPQYSDGAPSRCLKECLRGLESLGTGGGESYLEQNKANKVQSYIGQLRTALGID